MTSKTKETKPSYVFRASWAILLLAINFLVAAYYFHIVELVGGEGPNLIVSNPSPKLFL